IRDACGIGERRTDHSRHARDGHRRIDGTSISLHDGDRDLTCTLGPGSPSTASFAVGRHVKAICTDGVLTAIAPVTAGDVGRYFTGTVSQLTTSAITLATEHGPVTCTITPFSP